MKEIDSENVTHHLKHNENIYTNKRKKLSKIYSSFTPTYNASAHDAQEKLL